MKLLDLTLDLPAANIALDEALLESAEQEQHAVEVLRLWEPASPIVVLGRSSEIQREANLSVCDSKQIPVIRRCSGGATILTAPNCLMYAVLLSYQARPHLRMLEQAHQFVVGKIQLSIQSLGVDTDFQGTCDLTINDRKVSGNALRCKKNWVLYHGTLLCQGVDLELIDDCLGDPKRQPDYRQARSHANFITAMPISSSDLSAALIETWDAKEALTDWPEQLTNSLVESKYSLQTWNQRI